jgi:hypothetical protein
LKSNQKKIDSDELFDGVMAIADEVDAQLAQAMTSYVKEAEADGGPSGPSAIWNRVDR